MKSNSQTSIKESIIGKWDLVTSEYKSEFKLNQQGDFFLTYLFKNNVVDTVNIKGNFTFPEDKILRLNLKGDTIFYNYTIEKLTKKNLY